MKRYFVHSIRDIFLCGTCAWHTYFSFFGLFMSKGTIFVYTIVYKLVLFLVFSCLGSVFVGMRGGWLSFLNQFDLVEIHRCFSVRTVLVQLKHLCDSGWWSILTCSYSLIVWVLWWNCGLFGEWGWNECYINGLCFCSVRWSGILCNLVRVRQHFCANTTLFHMKHFLRKKRLFI